MCDVCVCAVRCALAACVGGRQTYKSFFRSQIVFFFISFNIYFVLHFGVIIVASTIHSFFLSLLSSSENFGALKEEKEIKSVGGDWVFFGTRRLMFTWINKRYFKLNKKSKSADVHAMQMRRKTSATHSPTITTCEKTSFFQTWLQFHRWPGKQKK